MQLTNEERRLLETAFEGDQQASETQEIVIKVPYPIRWAVAILAYGAATAASAYWALYQHGDMPSPQGDYVQEPCSNADFAAQLVAMQVGISITVGVGFCLLACTPKESREEPELCKINYRCCRP